MKRLALALAFGAALAPGANALEYTALRPEASAITFAYQQMGVGLDGRFTRFDGELSFDPAQLEAARARIEVELASIDTGSPEGNEEVVHLVVVKARRELLVVHVAQAEALEFTF